MLSVCRLRDQALDRYGKVHVAFLNAGVAGFGRGSMWELDLKDWAWGLAVNVWGVIHGIKALVPVMIDQQDEGHVVITSSSVGVIAPTPNGGIYNMTKAALIHQTKHLAGELGPGVRVNAIAPGLVKTDTARALWEPGGDEREWPWPLSRLGEPLDIARAALYLATDLSAWVTGDVLVVDGGNMTRS